MHAFSHTNQSWEDKYNEEMEKISLITTAKTYTRANFKRSIQDLHEGRLKKHFDGPLRIIEYTKYTACP